MNRGNGGKFLRSSHKPISPSIKAGARTEVASQNVDEVKLDTNEAEYETVTTPMIIATPPRYGTGILWDLWFELGRSTTSVAIATFLIKGVSNPTSK